MAFGWLKRLGRGARTAEKGADELSALARFKNVFRGAERAEETASEAGKVGKRLKNLGKGVTAAGATAFSAFRLLTIASIADDINETFNSPHATEIVSAIFGIVAVIVGYLIFSKISSAAGTVKDAVSSKKSGGGVKKLSDTVCFFILISFIFIINFLYEKYLELEKEKEKLYQLDYQVTQNY